MTTYYVSSEIGNDNNAGTSATSPLGTLQAAADLVKPGDTVEVMNGTYTNGGTANDVLTISTSGTASAPITFEAAPGATPVIDSSGAWQGIEINASYITINGFTVVGDAASITLSDALANSGPGQSYYDGNGIGVALNDQTANFHNIIIENNTIYNEPGAGIATIGADYLQILNNNVHDNAHWSAYGQSGISIAASVNFDNAPGPHIIVSGNTSVNNAELVPEYRANAITDGEGIILDSNYGYTGGFLVQNNTTHGNSGPGIEALGSDNTVITGNTTTGDLTYAPLASEGEIFNNQSTNVTITNNNIGIPPPPPSPAGELVVNGGFETGDFSGWTQSGDVGLIGSNPQLFITQAAHTGNNAAGFGSQFADGTISQNLTTVAGQTYTFDFWLANMSGGPNDFTAKIGGVTELHLVNDAAQPYTHYTYTFTATSTSTPIEFDFLQEPSAWNLDDVSVAPAGSSPPPPPAGPPAAPVIMSFTPNTGGVDTTSTINLAGTAEAGSTVTVSDGGAVLGTAPVDAARSWTFVELNAANGTHTFTATDTDANGTSAASTAFSVPVNAAASPPPPPAAPVIMSFTPNTGGVDTTSTINLAGTAEAGSTVTVSDGGAVLGTAPVDAARSWTFVELNAANGTHTFTATDTDANGTSAASTAFSVPVNVAGSPPPPPPSNLVVNGGFETNSFTGWTLSGNVAPLSIGPQAFIIGPSSTISSNAQSGQFAAGFGSMFSDGTLSQNIQTTAGQSYTVQFWLANASGGPDDFTAKWNGQTLLALTNAAAQGYTEYTYNVVGTASTSNLEFDFRQDPSYWSLDSISVTPVGSDPPPPPIPPPVTTNLVANGGFETNSFTGWTLSGNVAPLSYGPQAYITGNAQSGQFAAGLGSVGPDGTLSQNIQTTAGQHYTLDFWLANASGGPDDFTAKWNGQTLLALKNTSAQGYTEYTYDVVGTAGTSNLEFDFRQDPSHWSLDNISVTAVGSQTNAQPSGITASNGQTGASVTNALAQSNPAPSQNDSIGTMATLLSQFMATSNGSGASVSAPPVVAQSSPPPVTLVSPFHA